jgi:4-hydroxybenzoate polyprenyltransferase
LPAQNPTLSPARKWIIYQKERFPLAAHGPLVAAFSLSAVCFSSLLRGDTTFPKWTTIAVAFLGSLFFFLQLRIADEFKDAEEDAKYRPYRPVPRGLISLRELGVLGAIAAACQLLSTCWLYPPLVAWLVLAWSYLALMSKEFFVGGWLRAHPFTYLWTHMLIMPLIDIYTSACDWLPAGAAMPGGLKWFLIASFFNGMVIEVGRKIRAPEKEEEGVQTYTVIWGRTGAVLGWLAAMTLTMCAALLAASSIGFASAAAVALGCIFIVSLVVGGMFVKSPKVGLARAFEPLSGLWTLTLYLSLGVVPLLLHR